MAMTTMMISCPNLVQRQTMKEWALIFFRLFLKRLSSVLKYCEVFVPTDKPWWEKLCLIHDQGVQCFLKDMDRNPWRLLGIWRKIDSKVNMSVEHSQIKTILNHCIYHKTHLLLSQWIWFYVDQDKSSSACPESLWHSWYSCCSSSCASMACLFLLSFTERPVLGKFFQEIISS